MEIKIAGYTAASHLLEREPGRWHAVVILGAVGPFDQVHQRVGAARRHVRIEAHRFVVRRQRGIDQAGVAAGMDQSREWLRIVAVGARVAQQPRDRPIGVPALRFKVGEIAMRDRQIGRQG